MPACVVRESINTWGYYIRITTFISIVWFSSSSVLLSQVDGDYQTRAAGNWSVNTTWQVRSGGAWINCSPGDYPGTAAGAGTVTIRNGHSVSMDISPANAIGALTINNGNANTTVTIPTTYSLTVTGTTTISANTNNINKYIEVTGSFVTGSLALNSTNVNTRDSYVNITSGTVTVIGNITMNNTNLRTYICFSGDGTLQVGGTISGGGITSDINGSATAPTSGTVNYNNAGAQTAGTYVYYNLTLSGSGNKTTTGITVNNMLSMEGDGTVTASVVPSYAAGASLRYMGSAAQTTGVEFPASWTGSGGVYIENANGVTLNAAKNINANQLTIGGTVAGSVFNDEGYQLTGTGTLNLTSGIFRLGSVSVATTWPAFGTNNIAAGTTVEYASGVAQSVSATPTYQNLTLSGAGTKTAGGALTINEAFSVSGGTLNTSNNLNVNGTSSCGGSVNATGGTATYAATATNIIAGTYYNLVTPANATFCGATTVSNSFAPNGVINTTGDIDFTGTVTCGTGSINATGGTVTYSNAVSNILPGTYNNLTISNGVTATMCAGTTNVTGTLSLEGATLNMNGSTLSAATVTRINTNAINIGTGTFTVNSSLSLTASDPVTFTGSGFLNVSGDLSCGALTGNAGTITLTGAFTPNAFTANTSTVVFNGSGPQTIPAFNYYNLTSNSTGDRTLSGTGTVGIAGTFTPGTNSYTITGSTVDYNGTTSQTAAAFNYHNLTVSGSDVKTLSGAITVDNDLSITGSAELASDVYQITGNGTGIFSLGAGTTLSLGNTGDPTEVLFPLNYTSIALDNASTIVYQSNNSQDIANLSYGNLEIDGGGVKSLTSATTINNTLTLTSGNLSIGDYDLTLYNPVFGSFDGSHMIVTGGTGYLIKQGTIANASMEYPVGTGAKYTPVTLAGTAGATSGRIFIRAVEGTSPNMVPGSESLAKYWDILTPDYTLNSGDVTFTWHGTEALGDPANFSLVQWTGGPAWEKRAAVSGTNSLTHALSNTIAGEWTTTERAVLYSYNTGDWHTASTWTTDPSGTELVGSRVPQDDDRVIILNGYTVTLTQDVTTSGNAMSVESGAILNLGDYRFTNTLLNLDGSGTIQSSHVSGTPSTGYFPDATGNTFVDAGGGTYEYTYNGVLSSFDLPAQATYNNLKINAGAGKTAIQVNDITLNGDLEVSQGTFQVNDATAASRTLIVAGDMDVQSGAALSTGSGAVTHNIILSGDFTNEGTVDLTNNADFAANTLGAADLTFTGSSNATAIVNAATSFYGFIVDKGSDQSFTVEVLSDAATSPFDGNNSNNVITLKNGTFKLGENITVSRLRTTVTNYDIGTDQNDNAGLWVNGADVTLGAAALVVYGNLKISLGSFNAMGMGQGSIVTREGGSIYIEGGTLTANQIRPSNTASHTGSWIQTGGTVNVNGPATVTDYPVFTWPYSTSQFHMSGGTLNVSGPTASGTAVNGGIVIGVGAENYSVTGGTVNVTIPASAVNFNINSTVPFWNLNINKAGAGAGTLTLAAQPHNIVGLSSPIAARALTILNDLNLNSTNSPTLNAGGQNVEVKGDFTISSGATYTPGSNTTIFSGTSAQAFDNSGTITAGLYKFKVNKSAGTLNLGGSVTDYTVTDSLIISQGTLDDGGMTINVAGNIYTAGTHTGSGKITLNASVLQTIEASSIGSPSLGNLEVNNGNGTAGFVATQLLSDLTVNTLILTSDHIFDIGVNGLTVNTNPISGGTFSATRMILTAGNSSDGGLTVGISGNYPANTTIAVFPVGTAYGYTATEIRTNASGASGNLSGNHTIIPVNSTHPAATIGGFAIPYYWRSKTSITGANNTNIDIRYTYYTVPPSFTFWFFFTAYYHPWLIDATGATDMGNNVSSQSLVPFIGIGFIDSDYSVGATAFGISPFNLFVRTLYSRDAAPLPRDWNDRFSWSETGHGGGAAVDYPNAQDNVIIGNDHTVVADADNAICATLEIGAGSTLDLSTYTGHTFDVVTGSGELRISSSGATARFPTGDFGEFLNEEGGTVEYYITGTQDFTIPTRQGPTENLTPLTHYRNLEITPTAGRYIAMPNTDLEIYDSLTVQGAGGTAIVRLNTAAARTLLINGSLNITGGNLQFRTGTTQTLNVLTDVNVSAGAVFDVENTAGTAHSMSITGNLTNNGTFDMRTANTCNVTFTGSVDKSITGTTGTALTDFNNLTIDKGTSQTPVLTVDVDGTFSSPDNNWLTLSNGTFRYKSASDLNISTTSAFTIPQTACLHINNAATTVSIADNASDNNDLYLNGKLLLENGTVNIGDPANNNNNDIEYSESCSSELTISGGTLFVNGQIRRNTTSLGGILQYTQTGGDVTINGRNANTARSKLEVLNTGSSFILTGGTLFLVRGGGTTYGDLYLRPASSSTSAAGNIYLATASGTGNQTFLVDANVPLGSLTVNGFDAGNTANAQLNIDPLVLYGGLTINANGTFNTNNLDLTLAGDFDNSGTFTAGTTDVTTFNGVTQTLSGNNTTFCNLAVNPSTSVTLKASSNITVNDELRILSGSLVDGGNTITVKGNLINYTTHTSSNPAAGGILLQGTLNQVISGNGSSTPAYFGRVELDNGAGALLQQDVTFNDALILTNGSINIDDQLLTIGSGASLTPGAGSFGISKMIYTNGAITTARGITMPIPASASDITCPIGVNGKYTPVRFDYSANSTPGSVNVIAINNAHPTALYPDNVLQYYWAITSSGISNFIGDIYMYYLDGDVSVTPPNTESDYISGRLSGATWTKLPGLVDDVNNISQFPFTSATTDFSGDFTAGIDTALPTTVPTYYSNVDFGNWGDITSWTPVPSAGVPNGAIMVIQPGDTIILETDNKKSYKTTINGRLEVGSTIGHYLGIVDGTGVLALTDGKLPAGRFDQFFSCAGGALEYGDSGTPKDYTMSTIPSTLRMLLLTGGGKRIMPNKDITICELLDIGGTTTLDNSVNNRTIYLNGDITRDAGASFSSGTGSGAKVVFQGSSAQSVGTFTTTNAFNHVQLNNSLGLTLTGPVDMKGNLTLTSGNITTTSANILYMNSGISTVSPTGGSFASFVNGPLKKKITGGYLFQFPIGKGTRYGKAAINLPNDGDWTAEYFNTGRTGMAVPAFASPLTAASTTEYWTISGPASKQAYVTLRWDPVSDIRPAVSQDGIAGMRVAELNTGTSQWNEQTTSASGDNNNGTATTTDKMNLDTHDYTLACVGTINARARFSSTDDVCVGGSIPVEFTGITGNYTYTISYTIGGADQTDITGINASTTTITASTAGEYELNGFTYNIPTSPTAGIFDATTVTVNEAPSTADAGADQTSSAMCGLTSTLLEGNTSAVGTGSWSVVSGSGGVIDEPSNPTSTFNGTSGVTYVLRWTISNDPCTPSTDDVTISFLQAPAVTLSGDNEVCSGSAGHVYSTESGMSSYVWNVTGGTVTAGGTGVDDEVTVSWGAAGTGQVSVNYTNANGCDADLPTDLSVTIKPLPVPTITGSDTVCQGVTVIYATEAGMSNYFWTVINITVDTAAHTIVAGGTATDNTITIRWDGYEDHRVSVNYEDDGCAATLPTDLDIWVSKQPEPGPAYHIPNDNAP